MIIVQTIAPASLQRPLRVFFLFLDIGVYSQYAVKQAVDHYVPVRQANASVHDSSLSQRTLLATTGCLKLQRRLTLVAMDAEPYAGGDG